MTRTLIVSGDVVGERMAGPGIRAWELAGALHRAGREVVLAAPGTPPPAPFETVALDRRAGALEAAARAADGIVAQGLVLAHYPFLAALDIPIVVDVYDPFVLETLPAREDQSAAGRARHHRADLAALNAQLERGDFFVCASEQQRDYWLGMLVALGRVNPATYDDDPTLRRLIDVVPFGLPDTPPAADAPVLRGVTPGVENDDFVILWGGGIWNWFDPLTLIRAVDEVARERDDVRLVFMGTQTPSPFVPRMTVAEQARRLARERGLLDAVVFFNEGWVPYDERAGYLLEADVGTSFHRPHIETRFAFRTRLLDYIWAGLPMLVTEGDVLSALVAEHDLGRVVPPEDVSATVDALWSLIDDPLGRAGYTPRFEQVRAGLTWDHAAAPLAVFAAAPYRAADAPAAGATPGALTPTPARALPGRALELLREGGPLLLAEEAVRYVRWLRRPRG